MTGYKLIQGAYRLAGVLKSGQTPTGDQYEDGLAALNEMIDSWNSERLAIYQIVRSVFNLTSGVGSYTYGTGGTFNAARPARINGYGVITQTSNPQPIELPLQPLTMEQYQAIPLKSTRSALPTQVWDDNGFPLRTLYLWPVPNVSALQLAVYPWVSVQEFSDFTTDYTFPPAYLKSIRYNLAISLAAENGRPASGEVIKEARRAFGDLKTINVPIFDLQCDPALVGGGGKGLYNWITDSAPGSRQF